MTLLRFMVQTSKTMKMVQKSSFKLWIHHLRKRRHHPSQKFVLQKNLPQMRQLNLIKANFTKLFKFSVTNQLYKDQRITYHKINQNSFRKFLIMSAHYSKEMWTKMTFNHLKSNFFKSSNLSYSKTLRNYVNSKSLTNYLTFYIMMISIIQRYCLFTKSQRVVLARMD